MNAIRSFFTWVYPGTPYLIHLRLTRESVPYSPEFYTGVIRCSVYPRAHFWVNLHHLHSREKYWKAKLFKILLGRVIQKAWRRMANVTYVWRRRTSVQYLISNVSGETLNTVKLSAILYRINEMFWISHFCCPRQNTKYKLSSKTIIILHALWNNTFKTKLRRETNGE